MPNHETVVDLAETMTLLKINLSNKEQELVEANKRIEYLENELQKVLRDVGKEHHDEHA